MLFRSAFELNHLSIEATQLPPDVSLHDQFREVRPQDRSGVVVKFPLKVSHGATVILVDVSGVSLPVGSSAKLRATGVTVPVGYDGEAYLEDLSPTNELTVERADGSHCTATFAYHPLPGEIPSIGPVRCVGEKP